MITRIRYESCIQVNWKGRVRRWGVCANTSEAVFRQAPGEQCSSLPTFRGPGGGDVPATGSGQPLHARPHQPCPRHARSRAARWPRARRPTVRLRTRVAPTGRRNRDGARGSWCSPGTIPTPRSTPGRNVPCHPKRKCIAPESKDLWRSDKATRPARDPSTSHAPRAALRMTTVVGGGHRTLVTVVPSARDPSAPVLRTCAQDDSVD